MAEDVVEIHGGCSKRADTHRNSTANAMVDARHLVKESGFDVAWPKGSTTIENFEGKPKGRADFTRYAT